jgi:hypothetical protein
VHPRRRRACESSVDTFVRTLRFTMMMLQSVCNPHFESTRDSHASTASDRTCFVGLLELRFGGLPVWVGEPLGKPTEREPGLSFTGDHDYANVAMKKRTRQCDLVYLRRDH